MPLLEPPKHLDFPVNQNLPVTATPDLIRGKQSSSGLLRVARNDDGISENQPSERLIFSTKYAMIKR